MILPPTLIPLLEETLMTTESKQLISDSLVCVSELSAELTRCRRTLESGRLPDLTKIAELQARWTRLITLIERNPAK